MAHDRRAVFQDSPGQSMSVPFQLYTASSSRGVFFRLRKWQQGFQMTL